MMTERIIAAAAAVCEQEMHAMKAFARFARDRGMAPATPGADVTDWREHLTPAMNEFTSSSNISAATSR